MEADTAGDPMTGLKWTRRTTAKIAAELKAFDIEGLDKGRAASLKRGLVLAGQFKIYRRKYPEFYPRLLAEDLQRTKLFLARRGYPRARITPRFMICSKVLSWESCDCSFPAVALPIKPRLSIRNNTVNAMTFLFIFSSFNWAF